MSSMTIVCSQETKSGICSCECNRVLCFCISECSLRNQISYIIPCESKFPFKRLELSTEFLLLSAIAVKRSKSDFNQNSDHRRGLDMQELATKASACQWRRSPVRPDVSPRLYGQRKISHQACDSLLSCLEQPTQTSNKYPKHASPKRQLIISRLNQLRLILHRPREVKMSSSQEHSSIHDTFHRW
ncbi:hypothetical protein MPTK2_3g05700 [Marchantia polymorpha subsp. ruderalis]